MHSSEGGYVVKMMSLEEVAERLGVHRTTVYRLVMAGELPAAKIGRQWRIEPDDLERYLRRARMGTPPATEPNA